MACARRKDRNIPSSDFDFTTSGSAQHQSRGTARKSEYLVSGRMIVMEGINTISPLRRPASALEERLEGRSCLSATLRSNHAPIQQDGKNRIIESPVSINRFLSNPTLAYWQKSWKAVSRILAPELVT